MTPSVAWPSGMPCPLYEGKTQRIVDPTVRTPLASGRTRVRRAFTSVPVDHQVTWRMTRAQAAQFESFYRATLTDGTLWFAMPLPLPQGDGPWAFQFAGPYSGPDKIGPDVYEVRAALQQWLRAGEAVPIDQDTYRELESGEFRILE